MRLDARKGDYNWWIYHAEECRVPKLVVWIDDETNEWGQYRLPMIISDDTCLIDVHKAKKILILADRRLVIINPVGDAETDAIATTRYWSLVTAAGGGHG